MLFQAFLTKLLDAEYGAYPASRGIGAGAPVTTPSTSESRTPRSWKARLVPVTR